VLQSFNVFDSRAIKCRIRLHYVKKKKAEHIRTRTHRTCVRVPFRWPRIIMWEYYFRCKIVLHIVHRKYGYQTMCCSCFRAGLENFELFAIFINHCINSFQFFMCHSLEEASELYESDTHYCIEEECWGADISLHDFFHIVGLIVDYIVLHNGLTELIRTRTNIHRWEQGGLLYRVKWGFSVNEHFCPIYIWTDFIMNLHCFPLPSGSSLRSTV